MIRIGVGGSVILECTTESPKNPVLIIKAPTLC